MLPFLILFVILLITFLLLFLWLKNKALEGLNRFGAAAPSVNKDGTACLTGKCLFLDFEELEINGDKKIVMNSTR
ncbi:MAG: hypothetical protein ACRDE7_04575, partial [Sphingobacterium sp.]